MVDQLALATLMVVATVLIHGVGLFLIGKGVKLEEEQISGRYLPHLDFTSTRGLVVTLGIVLSLFVLHGIEIWAYGLLYYAIDAIPNLEHAVYFSTITYGTVGYDDEGMSHTWQLVAAIEGINGIILMGWSTAFFVALITRMKGSGEG